MGTGYNRNPQPGGFQRVMSANPWDEAAAHDSDIGPGVEQSHLPKGVGQIDLVIRRQGFSAGTTANRLPQGGEGACNFATTLRVSGRHHQQGAEILRSPADQDFLSRMGVGRQND